jgi:hypothetical protein
MSASLPHILISMEEYDRLKEIESQYEQLHKGIQKDLQIPSKSLRAYSLLLMYNIFFQYFPILNIYVICFRNKSWKRRQ